MKIRIITLLSMVSCAASGQNMQLLDSFDRLDDTVVGAGWSQVGAASALSNNMLRIGTGGLIGKDYVWRVAPTNYATYMSSNSAPLGWAFNIKQSRIDPSGFDNANYGAAFILAASTNSFTNGAGYAVVYGQSGASDPLRLVAYTNGLRSNNGLSEIMASGDYGTEYLSVRITYSNHQWRMYTASDTGSFANPSNVSVLAAGPVSNSALVEIDLPYLGCFFNHSSGASEYSLFDNIYVPIDVPSANTNAPDMPKAAVNCGWEWANPWPNGEDLRDVIAGGGTTILIGKKGTLLATTDGGATFSTLESGISANIGGIVWDGTRFVAVAPGYILISSNGIDWSASVSMDVVNPMDIAWGNGRYMVVQGGSDILVSTKAEK
jgi:hypothetical protein